MKNNLFKFLISIFILTILKISPAYCYPTYSYFEEGLTNYKIKLYDDIETKALNCTTPIAPTKFLKFHWGTDINTIENYERSLGNKVSFAYKNGASNLNFTKVGVLAYQKKLLYNGWYLVKDYYFDDNNKLNEHRWTLYRDNIKNDGIYKVYSYLKEDLSKTFIKGDNYDKEEWLGINRDDNINNWDQYISYGKLKLSSKFIAQNTEITISVYGNNNVADVVIKFNPILYQY